MNAHACLASLAASLTCLAVAAQSVAPQLFVVNRDSSDISTFALADDGAVTPMLASPMLLGLEQPSLAGLTPDGAFMLVVSAAPSVPGGSLVRGLRVQGDGSMVLEPSIDLTLESAPIALAIAQRDVRTFVYLFPFLQIVYAYELIDGSRGATLQPVRGQPFDSPGFIYFGDAAVAPDAQHLYVVKLFGPGITGYAIASDGSLTMLNMPQQAALSGFRAVEISPDGMHLYAATQDDVPTQQTSHVRAFAIAANGLLSELPGSPFSVSSAANDRVGHLAIAPDGAHLVATNDISQTVTLIARNADGGLVPTFQSATMPQTLVDVQMSDALVYLLGDLCANCSGVIPMQIADAALTPLSPPVPAGQGPAVAALWLPPASTTTGDLDGDGHVNAVDLALLLGAWGGRGPADLDGNGVVGAADLGILLGAWTG